MILLVCNAQPLAAQTANPGADAGYALASGDAWLNKTLPDINLYAQRYTESFLDELVRYAGMPRNYAYALINTHGWFPADVYFAAMLAKALGISYRDIVRARAQNADWNWEELVSHLDNGSETDTYRQIRENTRLSYRRWARPLNER